MAAGADARIRDNFNDGSALDNAARVGYADVVETILEHGGRHARTLFKRLETALHAAVCFHDTNLEVTDALIGAGVNIETCPW